MSTLVEIQAGIIEDRLPQMFYDSQPLEFPLLMLADRTVQGVQSSEGANDDIGRSFCVKHGWTYGQAGMTRPINPLGSAAVDIGQAVKVTDASNSDSQLAPIPSAAQSPHVGSFVRTLYLHANAGNLGVPLSWLFTDQLSATKVKQLLKDMEACARMTRRQDAISYSSFRATGASTYKVTVLGRGTTFAKATDVLASGSTNANFVNITIDESYGSINNFWEGMEVDIVKNSGGDATTEGTLQDGTATNGTDVANYTSGAVYVQCFVTKVNRKTKVVTIIGISRSTTDGIATYSDTTGWQGTNGVAAFDWICPRGASTWISSQRPWLTNGVEDWMAATGQIMGGAQYSQGLDLSTYPMFQSLVANLAGPLTEDFIDTALMQFGVLFPQIKLTDIITTGGGLLQFKESLKGSGIQQTWPRSNLPFQVKGGWSVSDYTTPAGTQRWWINPYCLKGRCYIQSMDAGNLKLYTNHILGKTQSNYAEGIQFLGPLLGYPTIRVPESASNGTPNFITGTPWIRFALLCPIMPNGVKAYNVTEKDLSGYF